MKHILFSNYHWENDEHGKDHYDYARECLWEEDEGHRFADTDYYDDEQLCIEGCETYTCPICGEIFPSLAEAKECCRDEKWETMDDIPDNDVYQRVSDDEDWNWRDIEVELKHFMGKSTFGFLLCGNIGRWNGTFAGGYFVKEFKDLYDCWRDCDYIKIYDENGHLYITCSHHDGTNHYELKELTWRGSKYKDDHYYDMDDRELHEKLWNSNFYTRLPHYAHKVWGCKKGA